MQLKFAGEKFIVSNKLSWSSVFPSSKTYMLYSSYG